MRKNYMEWLKTACLVAVLTILNLTAFAQDRRVTGTVKDGSGQGIPGVNIILKGTLTGTTTDSDGAFSIGVKSANDVLAISAIGFKAIEVPVGSKSTIDISLDDDVSQLSEVIVTGYTIDNRRETAGAVATVKAKDLATVPSGNVEQQLAGRVAGVTVVTNGQPGTTSQIRVRGFGAFGGNEPLYVVDGVPVGTTDFLNPDDIETTTVLKDAAAASIYGARAANGVIVYTTKKGSTGAKKLSITYDGLFGATDPGTPFKMLNPQELADWTWQAAKNDAFQNGTAPVFSHPQFGEGSTPVIPDYINVGGTPGVVGSVNLEAERAKYNVDPRAGSIYQVVKANKQGTDWYDAITRTAPMMRHSLGFSGGGENSRFYLGFGAQNQAGILLYNNFKRYSFRANSEFKVTKNLRIGENLQFTYRQVLAQGGENGGLGVADDENDINLAYRMPTIIPIYDEFGGYAGTAAKGFNNPRNPVANRDGAANNRGFGASGFGNIYAEYDVLPGLTLRTTLGGNYSNFYNWNYSRLQYENSENNSAFGYGEGGGFSFAWTVTNTAAYKKRIGKHNMDFIVGQEALNTGSGRNINGNGLNPFSTDTDYITLNTVSGSGRVVGSNYFKGVNFYSLFGRANYIFNDKYILTGVLRRDGSSRFGVNNRYGVFPAVSAAWRLSSEDFMKSLSWITDFKIRGGYGLMGNSNNVDPNNQFSLFGASIGLSSYDINGSNSSAAEGFYRTRIGNPNAKWETSITTNIGFDGTFFNGKLDVILDLWKKETKDLLFQVPVTSTLGYRASAPSVNTGNMLNQGVDIQVITRGKVKGGDLGYELNLTAGLLRNEITGLAGDLTYLTTVNPGYRGINPIRNQLGQSISAFFGYDVIGLFQNAEEVRSAATQEGAAPGRLRYRDVNGDGRITPEDRTYLGSPVPKFSGGIGLTLTYKAFDMNLYANGVAGNQIFNVSRWFTDFYPSFLGSGKADRIKDSWTPQNTGATIPIYESASNFSTNTQASSYYVEDGSYFRIQNLSVGYTLPTNVLNRIGMQRLRIFASTNNLLTLSKYSGLDPSVGGNADTQFGIDVGNYPITRSWNLGVNIGF
ncbi:SusC/RagA family TonB-linked outer membrane protein [Arundinibacter roseus]|uniref:TonB-dependent receptor n=1 Tax=Arundinibacter roseus TaxID=2070510 RepID=A0A4R4K6J0_9BACT|nr:TonB-dependent receptor [Arundinibacter roseus]TDB62292.1 TonB-dependent receptor [Arundinibacter roseus]